MSYGKPQPPNWSESFSPTPQPPPPRRSAWPWLAIIGVVSLVALLVCCGGGLAFLNFGFGVMSDEIEVLLRDNERLRQHVGEIQEFEMDWQRSLADDDDDTFTYRVKGDKGSGAVIVKHITNDDGDEEIVSARLQTESGQTIEIVP